MLNRGIILNILGLLLIISGLLMLLSLPISIYFGETDIPAIGLSALITTLTGLAMYLSTRKAKKEIKKRDGYVIVTFGWIIVSVFGSLPYIISGAIPSFTNAFFETMSGFTTTGASILTDIESVPRGILFWRSTTQWIGGLGIIVLTIAILPLLGIGGMELFVAEAPGPTTDKLHPRIKETAKRLWIIYVSLTLLETILLTAGGMSTFDALNHAFTTMSSGGFSTRTESIAFYDSPFIQYTIIIFMILAGTNFTMIYYSINGRFRSIQHNEEFRNYLLLIVLASVVVVLLLYSQSGAELEESIRQAIFMVVSIITTTGFVTADYTAWMPFLTILFFLLMFSGASAGSTSGGLKIVRHTLLFKNMFLEFKRLLHPRAIIPVRMSNKTVPPNIIYNILAFTALYVTIFLFSAVIISLLEKDTATALGAVAATLGNIGPGIGSVGPVHNFYHLSDGGKWFLSFLMLIGRLELFTVLIMFVPYFWKQN